jgi:hypothetical protein
MHATYVRNILSGALAGRFLVTRRLDHKGDLSVVIVPLDLDG